jgi:hypothetical protein
MTGTRLQQQRQHMQAEKYLLQALRLARAMQVLCFALFFTSPVCVCLRLSLSRARSLSL